MISPDAVDRVKDALRISDVVGQRVQLKRAGRIWKGLCCLHQEKTPSFTCDDARGSWHCFGCDTGGDAIEFVRLTQGLSFTEAVEQLARDAGVDLPKETPEAAQREARRLSMIEVLEMAGEWFREQLRQSDEARDYLKVRGVSSGQASAFGLGFAPSARSSLKQALAGRCTIEGLAQSGLVVPADGDGLAYDRFRSRLVFPIRDIRGRTVSFSGRLLGPGEPKYLNGPETEVFHKGATVFNADRARQPAHDGAPVLVCEGQFDVLACERAGFPAAVCTMGTAFTADHLKALWRLSDTPVVLFDGDKAGQKAAAKVMATAFPLVTPGRTVKFAQMPSGADPDDLVRVRGPEALRAVVDGSEGLADAFWRVSIAGRSLSSPEAVAALEHEMGEAFRSIPDEALRKRYREDMHRRIRAATVSRPVIRSNGYSNHSTNPGALRLVHGMPQRSGFSVKEACILAAAVSHPGLIAEAFDEVRGLSNRARQVMDEILHLVTELPEIEAQDMIAALQAKGIAPAIEEAYNVAHDAGIVVLDPGGSREVARQVLKP